MSLTQEQKLRTHQELHANRQRRPLDDRALWEPLGWTAQQLADNLDVNAGSWGYDEMDEPYYAKKKTARPLFSGSWRCHSARTQGPGVHLRGGHALVVEKFVHLIEGHPGIEQDGHPASWVRNTWVRAGRIGTSPSLPPFASTMWTWGGFRARCRSSPRRFTNSDTRAPVEKSVPRINPYPLARR